VYCLFWPSKGGKNRPTYPITVLAFMVVKFTWKCLEDLILTYTVSIFIFVFGCILKNNLWPFSLFK
jgi:hypothetical protein